MSDLEFPAPGNLPAEDPGGAMDDAAGAGPGTSAGEGTGLGGLGTSAEAGAADSGTGAGQGTGATGPGTTAGGSDTFGPPEVSGIGSGYGGQVSSAGPTGVPDATREAAATTLDGGTADLEPGAGLPEGEWQPGEAGIGVDPPSAASANTSALASSRAEEPQPNTPQSSAQSHPLPEDIATRRSESGTRDRSRDDTQDADAEAASGSVAEPEGWRSEDESDVVEEASMDSFPASDPPSYTPHRS